MSQYFAPFVNNSGLPKTKCSISKDVFGYRVILDIKEII